MHKTSGKEKMPLLFIGHGSPMNAVLINDYTKSMSVLGTALPRPAAILVISAHWLTNGTYITSSDKPKQIYDFYGFPQELYNIKYPCGGSLEASVYIKNALARFGAELSEEWGIDHASWSVLKYIFPKADVPVIELSLDMKKPEKYHYEMGRELRKLRENGILIIGSGDTVHNLRMMDFDDINAKPYDWAIEFDKNIKTAILNHDHEKIIDYKKMGKSAELSVPSTEHYLPLLYVLGASENNEKISFPHESIQGKSISMLCVKFETMEQ